MSNYQRTSLWQLVYLEQEVTELANKIDALSVMLELGAIDQGLYESLLRQVNKCHRSLKTACVQYRE